MRDDALCATPGTVGEPDGPPTTTSPALARQRLLAQIEEGGAAGTTIVWGPAGFGKSTLLANWLRRTSDDSVRIFMTERRLARADLWSSVVSALPRRHHVARSTTSSPRDHVEALFQRLSSPLILTIDGITAADVPELVDLLKVAVDARLVRVVASTREREAAEAVRAIASGDAQEIGPHDLLFTAHEIAELLAASGISHDDDLVAHTHLVSGGWAVLVRAAVGQLMRTAPAHSADLAETVAPSLTRFVEIDLLNSMPAEVRDFVLRTSIVDEVTPQLAETLSGQADAAARIIDLSHAGVFTPAPTNVSAFVLPPVMRVATRLVLSRCRPRTTVSALYAAAAGYFHANSDPETAVALAVASHDESLIVAQIESCWPQLALTSPDLLLDALATVAPARRRGSPSLLLLEGYLRYFDTHDPQAIVTAVDAARELTENASERDGLRLTIAELTAARARGQFDNAVRTGDAAALGIRALPYAATHTLAGETSWFWLEYGITQLVTGALDRAEALFREVVRSASADSAARFSAHGHLALIYALEGQLNRADEEASRAASVAGSRAWMDQPIGTPAHLAAAVIACERTQESDAAAELQRLLSTASSPEYLPFIAYAQGLTAILQRDIAAGIEAVQETLDRMGRWAPPPFGQNAADGCLAALLAAGGRHAEAAALTAGFSTVGSHAICGPLTRSFVHLLGGRPRDALAGLQPCFSHDRNHAPRTLLTAHLVAAVASVEIGDMIGAPRHFGRALAIARVRGIRRPFRAFPAVTIGELITCTRSASPNDSGVAQMCDELSSRLLLHPSGGATVKSRLSERERVILSHLGTELSIAQLAAVLYVSPNTLKSQIKSIYRKLGVNSRAAAVAADEAAPRHPTAGQFRSSSTIRPTMSTAEK